jgi:hypothetical protein
MAASRVQEELRTTTDTGQLIFQLPFGFLFAAGDVGPGPGRQRLFGKKERSCQTLQAVGRACRTLAEDFLTLCRVSGRDSGDLGAWEKKAGAGTGRMNGG